jgi:hypothetical protein
MLRRCDAVLLLALIDEPVAVVFPLDDAAAVRGSIHRAGAAPCSGCAGAVPLPLF